MFPRIAVRATVNARARKANIKLQIPSSYTNSVDGLTKVGSAFDFNVDVTIPDDFPEALRSDAVAFASNLMSHELIKAVMRDGYPAT